MNSYLLFTLAKRRFAVPLESVERVVHMVEITPLPDARDPIRGVVNVQGEAVPVVDLRALCAIEAVAPAPEHHLILVAAPGGTAALYADAAGEIATLSKERTVALDGLIPGRVPAEGIASAAGELIFIVDPKRIAAPVRSSGEACS